MTLLHKKGNLLDLAEQGEFDYIVHGANCLNTFGSGIAKEIKERYPIAYDADTKATAQWKIPVAKLGNFSYAITGTDKHHFVIINAYTQVGYLPRGIDHFEYESFHLILRKLEEVCKGKNVGFPYIGMGLAGGDSNRIIPMIENFAATMQVHGGNVTLIEFQP